MRRFLSLSIQLTLLAASFIAAPASSAAAETAGRFRLVFASGMTFRDAVLMSAEARPAARPAMIRSLVETADRLATKPALPASRAFPGLPMDVDGQRQELLRTVQDLRDGVKAPGTEGSGIDPFSVPVLGTPVADRRAWLIPTENMWVAIVECGGSGGCVETDRLQGRVTVNPGPVASRLDFNLLYSPNSGMFAGSHFEWWSLVDGEISINADYPSDGSGLYPNGPSSGSFTAESEDAHGGSLAHTVIMWASIPDWNTWFGGGARTDRAFCEADPTSNTCRY